MAQNNKKETIIMKISELDSEYDRLQLQYGAQELNAIYNGGCINNPDFCFYESYW